MKNLRISRVLLPKNIPHRILIYRFGSGRARSDVFAGPACRGFSEMKRMFGFCFRCSILEVKQISPAAPHHRKVSAPRPPLRLKTQPKSHSSLTNLISISTFTPHRISAHGFFNPSHNIPDLILRQCFYVFFQPNSSIYVQ